MAQYSLESNLALSKLKCYIFDPLNLFPGIYPTSVLANRPMTFLQNQSLGITICLSMEYYVSIKKIEARLYILYRISMQWNTMCPLQILRQGYTYYGQSKKEIPISGRGGA